MSEEHRRELSILFHESPQVREALRLEVDKKRRERIASTSGNVDARQEREFSFRVNSKTALMTKDEVMAAYRSYRDGVDIDVLAAQLWFLHGYKNVYTCKISLLARFRALDSAFA